MPIEQPAWNEDRARILINRTSILGIVLHDTAGSGTHRDTTYLRDSPESPKRKVSVDFTAEREATDGAYLWKLNPDLKKYACAHAGRATAFKGLKNGAVTHATIGIEICQDVNLRLKPLYTPGQVEAIAHLCAWLCQQFKLQPSDITTHRQIITDGSRSDPRQFPFEGEGNFWHHFHTYRGAGDAYLASLGIRKTPDAEKFYSIKAGDTLWGISEAHQIKLPDLLAANADVKLTTDSKIVPGQILHLP